MVADHDSAAPAPTAVGPHVMPTVAVPPALDVDVSGPLALVVALAPVPAASAAIPVAVDPDEAGPVDHHFLARRRHVVLDDVRGRPAHARAGEQQESEKSSHRVLRVLSG